MRFSVEWLKQWVELDLKAQDLADRLTASGLEVDEIEPVAAEFTDVVVGEVMDCIKHPDADKLRLCTVDAGTGELLQIVCGAPNARTGLKAPVAKVGAVLGGEFKIKKAKLRGVESFGMLCSARELGLGEDHDGLLELPADAPVGDDFRGFLGLNDHSIEVDLTPNRADCLSIRGLAQDISASCDVNFTPLTIEPVAKEIDDTFEVVLESPGDCPRFAGRVIRGIDPTVKTPLWMVEVLRRSGIRSISPVVDITNYVLMELGQPMHAYDFAKLKDKIIVRRGREGEPLTLLDGKEIELKDDMLAICDTSGPVGLGGIMGGLSTAVNDDTVDVFLEAAYFNPATIMGKARDIGLHTDASHRFERGVDPQGQVTAMERATRLLLDIVGGTPGPVVLVEEASAIPVQPRVNLRLSRLNRVLGSDLAADTVSRILQRLGMDFEEQNGEWSVTAPTSRFDIAIEEDLIEEVARVYGYNNLPSAMPSGELAVSGTTEREVSFLQIREALCANGYQETINYSFVDDSLLETLHMADQTLPLANPLSSDMDVMRTSLLPGLLTSLSRNLRRQQDRVKLFETGVVFHQGERMNEIHRVAGVACGSALPEQWGQARRAMDFYDIKGEVEQLLALRGDAGEIDWQKADQPWLHPGQSASIVINGTSAGWVGVIHPMVCKGLDINVAVLAFELDISVISKRDIPNAKEISRFPSIRRDLALLVPDHIEYEQLSSCVRDSAGDLLANLIVFDVYEGENVEKGYKSIAIGLILQNVSSTLTDQIADSEIEKLIQKLNSELGVQLRG